MSGIDLKSGRNGKAPVITLSSGYDMPVAGLGTYSLRGSVCVNSVSVAVQNGYRLIDTASFYGNEEPSGVAEHSRHRRGKDSGCPVRGQETVTGTDYFSKNGSLRSRWNGFQKTEFLGYIPA